MKNSGAEACQQHQIQSNNFQVIRIKKLHLSIKRALLNIRTTLPLEEWAEVSIWDVKKWVYGKKLKTNICSLKLRQWMNHGIYNNNLRKAHIVNPIFYWINNLKWLLVSTVKYIGILLVSSFSSYAQLIFTTSKCSDHT